MHRRTRNMQHRSILELIAVLYLEYKWNIKLNILGNSVNEAACDQTGIILHTWYSMTSQAFEEIVKWFIWLELAVFFSEDNHTRYFIRLC